MLTASQDESHIELAFAAGANDYLTKPIERRIVVARVESMIRAAEDHQRASSVDRMDEERTVMEHELREAARVQQARLPAVPLQRGGWTIAGALVPSRHIGGDFFDVMTDPAGSPIVALVDISGHGLAAALVAGSLAGELRHMVRSYQPVEAMKRLNDQLWRDGSERYACVALMVLQDAQATIINAGLPPICLVRDGGCRQTFEASGTPPGLVEQADYEAAVVVVRAGDRLVVMSDGLTEPFGAADDVSSCLGRMRLTAPGLVLSSLTSGAMGEQIRTILASAAAAERDDATLVVAQFHGAPSAEGREGS
jgi:phosphoserine phosphatase RsbU/P